MQRPRPTISSAGRRLLAALLICALGLAIATPARAATTHKHHGHGVAVVVVAADSQHALRGADTHGAVPVAAPNVALSAGPSATDAVATARSHRTASSPARGPPAAPA